MYPQQPDLGIDLIEWSRNRPPSVDYDFAASDLARMVVDGVPEVLDELPAPDSDVSLESLVADSYAGDISSSNVLITAGATSANALATADTLWQAESVSGTPAVLTETPGYEPLSATPRALGADVERFRRGHGTRRTTQKTAIQERLSEDVCIVSITNRHNPSGKILLRDEMRSLAKIVARTDSTLLVDEVYAPFVQEPLSGTSTTFGGPTAAGLSSTVVTNSLTKFFGFDTLRLGWAIADTRTISRMSSMQNHLLDISPTSRYFGRVALSNVSPLVERSRHIVRENARLLREFVNSRDRLSGVVEPPHTMAFLTYGDIDGDTVTNAALNSGVRVCPGRFFGDSSRFRLSLSRDPNRMAEGLKAFGDVLDSLE